MERGRPLKFATPEELQKAVDNYFGQNQKPTLAGLALWLGIDRQTLYNYKERPEFFDICKKAAERVEAKYEERLVYENAPTGVIFALKNMGWKDRQEVANSITMETPVTEVHIIHTDEDQRGEEPKLPD